MHVAVSGWFWGRPTTGSGQYLHHLMAVLPTHSPGVRFSLLLPGGEPAQAASPSSPSDLDFHVLLPPRLPHGLAKLWWEQVTLPRHARRLRANLLFVPYWGAPLWQPVPTVVTVHDVVQLLLPAYRGGTLMQMYTALVGRSARRSAAVLTVSQASKRDISARLGIPARRITAIHHGPNLTRRQPGQDMGPGRGREEEAVREKYGLPHRYFLYLGGFDVRKNVEGILRAYAGYLRRGGTPEVGLVVAGQLPDRHSAFAPDPRLVAREMHLPASQIHFIGQVDEADKAALYAGAVAFLFPSRYEGFGMPVLEAMAAGCPVVTSGQ